MTLYKIILPLCILSFVVSSGTAQKSNSYNKYTLLTYGLQDETRNNASRLIQQKWKIKILSLTGCIVTQELEDSVRTENAKIYKLIENEYGNDWKTKFDSEVETEYQIETQIDSLVKRQPYIKNKEIVNPSPGSPLPMYPLDTNGNYIVIVSTYNKQWKEKKLYRLKVNYRDNKIDILKDYTHQK